ncbi:MAG: enoyl-CoA hydratase/isomerase family protein [Vicinamibacterales bacterium]
MSTSETLFEQAGAVATLTFNRPHARNAMTFGMYEALITACDRVDADETIRVFVLTGAGDKAFVAGTDISQFVSFSTAADAVGYEHRIDTVIGRLERVRVPTIARVRGAATGGGCVIALTCDLRICTPDARFGVPVARTLGNCLSAANYARLVDLLGPARTKELLFTGRLVDAREAHALGLVTRVVDPEGLESAVAELADVLATNAPLTIRATKEMVRRVQEARRASMVPSNDLVTGCYTSDDFRNAVAAFLEKRPPRFLGR